MRRKIQNHVGFQITSRTVTTAAILGVMAVASIASVRPGQPLLRTGSARTPDILAPSVEPVVAQEQSGQANTANQGVHPPGSKPYGLNYGEWSALWWQRVFFIPPADNPNLDTSGKDC